MGSSPISGTKLTIMTKNSPAPINLLYCGDKGIARGVLVSVLSLLEHTSDPLQIFIMTISYDAPESSKKQSRGRSLAHNSSKTIPFSAKSAAFLDKLVKEKNPKSSVTLIDATEPFVANLPKKNMGSYFTPASMLRLYIDLVPGLKNLDRILYLDYDVLCRAPFAHLYNTDLTGVEAAGTLDIYGRHFYHYRGLRDDYMNSGVMLFNLPACYDAQIFKKSRDLCASRWMMLADQAALNKSIDHRLLMPRAFNEQGERPRDDTVFHHFSNNFKFWPYFHVQKVKPFEVDKIHDILKITEYDDLLEKYQKLEPYVV